MRQGSFKPPPCKSIEVFPPLYIEHVKDGSRLKKEDKNIQLWLEFLHQISIPSEIFDLSHRYMKNVSSNTKNMLRLYMPYI